MNKKLKNAVFYEIYPQSFRDSNSDGIGDFNGIIEKLDYIKDMGFTAIWMNPCFASPFTDAGYDVEDYYTVAPRYGTNEDLKRLFDEVHKRGMHIILDLVPGHTSTNCKWFKESAKPEQNEYSGRYIWTNSIWEDFGETLYISGSLRGLSQRDGCCALNFFSTQPALNYGFANVTKPWQSSVDSPEAMSTRQAIVDIILFWLGMGCDGFRVDMAGSLVKNDESAKETIKLWQDVLGRVHKKFPEAVFVSEWGDPSQSLLAGFDMDFLLHFGPSHYLDLFRIDDPYFAGRGTGDLSEFFDTYMANRALTDGKGLICIPSGNHDMVRLSYKLDTDHIKLAYAFLLSMPGVPYIYYGDEIGMRYLEGITSVEGGYERTGARSPMQWDNTPNSGFSSASPDKLYIMTDPSDDRPTVENQIADENSLLNEMKKLITIRKLHKALQESADIELVSFKSYPLIYKRTADDKTILVIINPANSVYTQPLDAQPKEVIYSYNGESEFEDGKLIIPPCSASFIMM